MTLEIYTTGGGELVAGALNALAAFMGTNTLDSMMRVAISAAAVTFMWQMVVQGSLKGFGQAFVPMLLIGGASIIPREDVVIIDLTDKGTLANRTVDNVPYSLAWVYSATSRTSFYITERMEVLLGTPEANRYSLNGMGFGAKLTAQASQWEMASTELRVTFSNFMDQCVVDAAAMGQFSVDAVREEGDLFTALATLVPQNTYFSNTVTGNLVSCRGGYADLQTALNDSIDEVINNRSMAQVAASPNFSTTGASVTATSYDISESLDASLAAITSGSETATTYLRQSMLLQSLDSGIRSALSSSPASLQDYLTARAEAQTRIAYSTAGSTAEKWVPLLKIVFEVLYVAAFPIVLILMFTPLVGTIIKSYFGGFVWLASWEPISAVLHYMVGQVSAGWYRDVLAASTGGAFDGFLMTFNNHLAIRSIEADVAAMAGYMMMLVPFISIAFFYGASKMTSLATSMVGVSQSASGQAGAMGSSGDISQGNVKANQQITSDYQDHLRQTSVLRDGGLFTVNADGTASLQGGTAISNTGRSLSISEQQSQTFADAAQTRWEAVEQQGSTLSSQISSTASELVEFGNTVSRSETSGGQLTSTWSTDQSTEVSEAMSTLQRFADQQGITIDQAAQIGVSAGLGLGKIAGVNGGLNARAGISESATANLSADEQSRLSESVRTLMSASESGNYGTSISAGSSGTERESNTFSELQSSASDYRQSVSAAEAATRTATFADSISSGATTNQNQAFINAAYGTGYTADQISAAMNPQNSLDEAVFSEIASRITSRGAWNDDLPGQTPDGYRVPGNVQIAEFTNGLAILSPEDRKVMLGELGAQGARIDFASLSERTGESVAELRAAAGRAHDNASTDLHEKNTALSGKGADTRDGVRDTIEATRAETEAYAGQSVATRVGNEIGELFTGEDRSPRGSRGTTGDRSE